MTSSLETFIHSSSEKGFSSVTSLVVGSNVAVLFDPPFLVPDAHSVVKWIKKTTQVPLKAVFITHHHPDHYLSANPILEAFPAAILYAAPYVCAGIDREYDEKMKYWPAMVGKENVPERPRKPTPFNFSFFQLDGNPGSPIILLGPIQGDSVDHTLFWLPKERVIICGDSFYARSTHVWVEEIETPQLLDAWNRTLDIIEALEPVKIIPGHLESGWTLDAKEDLAYMRKYLKLFAEKITYAKKKPQVKDLFNTFKDAFPQADKNLDFFLGHTSNQFGEGGKIWEENKHHQVGARTKEQLEGFLLKQ